MINPQEIQTSAVKERPILFSRPMVAALARGEKTQTRRIVAADIHEEADTVEWITSRWCGITNCGAIFDLPKPISCSFGAVGDHLWVREPWRLDLLGDVPCVLYSTVRDGEPCEDFKQVPDEHCAWAVKEICEDPRGTRRRHARYMPRWASRFLLEVVSIRVERVQEISEKDARAEGVAPHMALGRLSMEKPAKSVFMDLWESLHGPGAWERNEWVWVIEFRRLDMAGGEK